MRNVTVPIATCLGLARTEAIGAPVNLVLQRTDGGLHVLAMEGPTALAMIAAIKADISAPIEDQHRALAAEAFAPEILSTLPPDEIDGLEARARRASNEIKALMKMLEAIDHLSRERVRLQRTIRWALALAILIAGVTVVGIGLGRIA